MWMVFQSQRCSDSSFLFALLLSKHRWEPQRTADLTSEPPGCSLAPHLFRSHSCQEQSWVLQTTASIAPFNSFRLYSFHFTKERFQYVKSVCQIWESNLFLFSRFTFSIVSFHSSIFIHHNFNPSILTLLSFYFHFLSALPWSHLPLLSFEKTLKWALKMHNMPLFSETSSKKEELKELRRRRKLPEEKWFEHSHIHTQRHRQACCCTAEQNREQRLEKWKLLFQ